MGSHPAAHRCSNEGCLLVRAERDQLKRALGAVASIVHPFLDDDEVSAVDPSSGDTNAA